MGILRLMLEQLRWVLWMGLMLFKQLMLLLLIMLLLQLMLLLLFILLLQLIFLLLQLIMLQMSLNLKLLDGPTSRRFAAWSGRPCLGRCASG